MREPLLICPEDNLLVILRADKIPHQASVRRATGEKIYALRHSLLLYQRQTGEAREPIKIDGCFLVDDRGNISQIAPDANLVWVVSAAEFIDRINSSWDGDK